MISVLFPVAKDVRWRRVVYSSTSIYLAQHARKENVNKNSFYQKSISHHVLSSTFSRDALRLLYIHKDAREAESTSSVLSVISCLSRVHVYAHVHTQHTLSLSSTDMVAVQTRIVKISTSFTKKKISVDVDAEDPFAALREAHQKAQARSRPSVSSAGDFVLKVPSVLKVSEYQHDVGLWTDQCGAGFASLKLVLVPKGSDALDVHDSSTFDLYKVKDSQWHGDTHVHPLTASDESVSEFDEQKRAALLVAHHSGGAILPFILFFKTLHPICIISARDKHDLYELDV